MKDKHADALAGFILAHGLAAASLRPMAKAAGTSDRMIVYHFGDKAGAIEAGLARIAERGVETLEALLPPGPRPATELMPMLEGIMRSGAFDASVAVLLEVAALSLRGDAAMQAVANRIATDFRDWLAARLTEPERADELLRGIEGWGVLRGCGLDAPFPTG